MAAQGPPGPYNQEQIQMMLQAEAQQRGMTMDQLKEFHRQHVMQEAAKAGMTPPQWIESQKRQAFEQHQRQMQMQQQQGQGQGQGQPPKGQPPQGQPQPGQPQQPQMVQQQIPVNGNVEAKPEALAVAKFLKSQNLKPRTVIMDGQRKEMFKIKRAFRALHSDAYKKARTKNPLLPEVTNDIQARTTVQLLPLSMLALRVSKADPHEGHNHAKPAKEKRVKGQWTVKIERQQEFDPMMHYIWLYEGPQWKTKVWAGLVLVAVFALVMFPLWPLMMRQGVWYLSVGCMGLLGLFFVMAIFRLILFCLTVFTVPPGLWLFPNLFEDVGFFDSFKPLWGWQEIKKSKKKSQKAGKKGDGGSVPVAKVSGEAEANGSTVTSGVESTASTAGIITKRHATVEEVEDE